MLDTYDTSKGGGRDIGASKTYNPKTRTWVTNTVSNTYSNDEEDALASGEEESPPVSKPPTTSNPSSTVDSKKEAEKEFIEVEYNTLEGDLDLIPSKKTIRIKAGQTINIMGLGKFLSGPYFVASVKRTLSTSGFSSQTLTVIKTGFGNTMKGSEVLSDPLQETPTIEVVVRPLVVPLASPNSDIKTGDSVMIVGDATYSNSDDGKKVPEWVKKKILKVDAVSGDGRVRLSPINSWTYVRFVQKV